MQQLNAFILKFSKIKYIAISILSLLFFYSINPLIAFSKNSDDDVLAKSQHYFKNIVPSEAAMVSESTIPMANLEGEPSAFVNGHVNVITGDFNDYQVDMTLPGIDALTVERSFSGTTEKHGSLAAGWNLNLHGTLNSRQLKRKRSHFFQVVVTEGHGATSIYERRYDKHDKSAIPLSRLAYKKGLTNTSTGYISGQTNLRNNRVYRLDDEIFHVLTGAGGVKEYKQLHVKSDCLSITKEMKPDGNKLEYHYLDRKKDSDYHDYRKNNYDILHQINVKSLDDRVMGSITYEPIRHSEYRKFPHQDVVAIDGRLVRYHFEIFSKYNQRYESLLTKIERNEAPSESYRYIEGDIDDEMLISRKERPDGRFMNIKYYRKGNNLVGMDVVNISHKKDPCCNRVRALQAPVGDDDTPINIYRFYYSFDPLRPHSKKNAPRSGSTTVLDALDNKTVYFYQKDQRLKYIDKYSGDGNLYSRESLFWASYKSEQCSYLLTRTLANGAGILAFAKTYTYDEYGNVIQNSLYGNLTGRNVVAPMVIEDGSIVENGCECFKKEYKYSADGLNLLLWESDGIHETSYEYEQGTNKLSAKFVGEPNKIFLREFYEYNSEATPTKKIVDDGFTKDINNLSGVTERHITYYTPRTSYPFGFPEVIIEKYLDLTSGQEIQMNKVVNTHNSQGLLVKQMHYDSSDTYLYTLFWDYNFMGKLIREVDALNLTSEWRYDANGNCIYEKGPHPDVYKEFTYDLSNRLIREDEVHPDGVKSVFYRYNLLSQPIAVKDHHGNETLYEYDAFGRVTHITFPPIIDEDGVLVSPTISKAYDLMGNVISLIDSKGNETTTSFTLRGQIAKVTYPDGSSENKVYSMDGLLQYSIAKNGTMTFYTYDSLGRTIKAETKSSNGEILSVTSATYNAFHMLSETDAMGQVTYYEYYPNGQLKSRRLGQSLILYTYDSRGRLKTSSELLGPNVEDVIIKIKEYDLLGRLIEERTENFDSEITNKNNYIYEVSGKISETRFGDGSHSSTVYNSHGIATTTTDGEGAQTFEKHSFNHKNAIGQCVDFKEFTDPLGNITSITCDALGRTILTERKNSQGKLLQKQEIAYDLNGNRCRLVDTIITNSSERTVVTKWSYDAMNRLIACQEAVGSPDQKCTQTQYNLYGQKTASLKADGTALYYTYDHLGRLTSVTSSDNTIHYAYTYDNNNHPIKVDDLINNTSTIKEYDENGRLSKEILGHGLSLSYCYDPMGRPTQVLLPDNSGMAFKYKGALLHKVQRLSSANAITYEHVYSSYDLSGHLLTANLIGNAGSLNYSYDKNGRIKNANTVSWEESLSYDAIGNLVQQQLRDPQGEVFTKYKYDDLYQLLMEDGLATHNYQHDSLYNRTQKDNKINIHNDLNQLLEDGEASYTYDINGNLIKKVLGSKSTLFAYDALDRLISFTENDQQVRYYYDEANRRLKKEVYSKGSSDNWILKNVVKHLYQGQNEIGSVNSLGEIVELRLLGIGKGAEIGAAVALEINKKIFAPIYDHAGNVVCLIDAETGKSVESYRYSAFGEELFEDAISPWRYSSKRVDEESGLIYFGRRYYDPLIGRWISQDPIGRDGGPNLYAYVLNNPLTHCDLYGLAAVPMYGKNWERLPNTIKFSTLVNNIVTLPGKLIEFGAFHLIPVPGIKDAIGCIGYALQGNNPMKFTPSWNQPKSQIYFHKGNGYTQPNHRYLFYNGICNDLNDLHSSCAKYSKDNKGVDVYGIYNATNGLGGDLLEVIGQKIGLATEAQIAAERNTRLVVNGMGEHKDNAILFVKAHSQGCETVYNLSSGLRKYMMVEAYGPARILDNRDFMEVHNFLSPCDFVPYLADSYGVIKGIFNRKINFVKMLGCPLFCHFLSEPTYSIASEFMGTLHNSKYKIENTSANIGK